LPSRHSVGEKLAEYSFDGGVTTADGKFVESSMMHEAPCGVGGAYEATCAMQHVTVIYIGYLLCVWGHALTDSLKKLWFLNTDEGRRLLQGGARVAYVTLYNEALPDWQKELWRLAGFEYTKWMHVITPTRFDRIVVPDNSLVAHPDETRLYDERFSDIIYTIRCNAIKERQEAMNTWGDRVYLTRSRLKGGKDHNECEVEQLFRRLGYQIVAPEQLSVVEQINLWASCPVVATTVGSIAHAAMFMPTGSRLLLLSKADYVNGYQDMANRLSGASVTCVAAHHSTHTRKDMPWAGPFYLCVTPELAKTCGVSVRQMSVWMRPSYWCYCLRNMQWLSVAKQKIYIFYVRHFKKSQ